MTPLSYLSVRPSQTAAFDGPPFDMAQWTVLNGSAPLGKI
jgi:hypothetical protein